MKMKNIISLFVAGMLVMGSVIPTFAQKEEEKTVLTYEEALKIAIEKSPDLKNTLDQKEKASEYGKELSNKMSGKGLPTGTTNSMVDAKLSELSKASEKVNVAKSGADIQYNAVKDMLEFGVKASFLNIEKANRDAQLADAKIKNSLQHEKIARIKNEVGMESDYNLKDSQIETEKTQENKKASMEIINAEYTKLNKLLGFGEKEKTPLEAIKVEYQPLKDSETDLEYKIAKAKEMDPTLWAKEQEARLKQLDVDLYTFNNYTGVPSMMLPIVQAVATPQDSYTVKQIDTKLASNEVEKTKLDIENNVRTVYNQIKQLEAKYDSLKKDEEKLNEGIRVTKAKIAAGMGTEQELKDLELKQREIENGFYTITINHELLKMVYEKPFLYSAMAK